VMFKCTETHDQVRVWARYRRGVQASGPVKELDKQPLCPTCQMRMTTLSFLQWARLTNRPPSSLSDD